MAEIGRYATELWYVGVMVAVFVAVLSLFWGVRSLLASRANVVKDRLRRTVGTTAATLPQPVPSQLSASSRVAEGGILHHVLSVFSRLSRPTSEEELGRLRKRLAQAGFRGELALATYLSTKVVLGLGFGALVIWLSSGRPQPLRYVALYTILAMGVGYYLPNIWLHLRVKKRQAQINHALPDALDLVVTCVEAGLGLDAAMERVSDEIMVSSPLLCRELSQASLEMHAGMPRGEAFRRLAARTGVEELHNLAAIIIQTDIFGTSVAKSLRVQADAMRIRRTQIAEERAATVAVKLTIPLIFCILPTLFAVLMGPAAVKIIRVLLPTLFGGSPGE
jgi:tight adherence protein C